MPRKRPKETTPDPVKQVAYLLAHQCKQTYRIPRQGYTLAVGTRPLLLVIPDQPLSETGNAVAAEIVHAMLARPTPTAGLLDALDAFFARSGSGHRPADAGDLEPVVIVATPKEAE